MSQAATLPSPTDRLTQGPVLPVMLSLALPNMVAMVSAAAVSIAETAYVGALGRDALAAMAVVFPFVMLMQTVSGGAMGGAISAAVSRAVGADRDDAGALARAARRGDRARGRAALPGGVLAVRTVRCIGWSVRAMPCCSRRCCIPTCCSSAHRSPG